MNPFYDLPVIDLSGFSRFYLPEGPFNSLDPQTWEEEEHLKALLGTNELFIFCAQELEKPKSRELIILNRIITIAITELGKLVLVRYQVGFSSSEMAIPIASTIYVVEPDHYQDLQAYVESKVVRYQNEIEDILRKEN